MEQAVHILHSYWILRLLFDIPFETLHEFAGWGLPLFPQTRSNYPILRLLSRQKMAFLTPISEPFFASASVIYVTLDEEALGPFISGAVFFKVV